MLRNHLEEAVWAAVFAKHYDTTKCYGKAAEWAMEQNPPVRPKDELMKKRWAYEEYCVTNTAAENADCAVLALRRLEMTNEDNPGEVHILNMKRYLRSYDKCTMAELDFDSYEDEFEDVT